MESTQVLVHVSVCISDSFLLRHPLFNKRGSQAGAVVAEQTGHIAQPSQASQLASKLDKNTMDTKRLKKKTPILESLFAVEG
jgi:hypothetical protein